MGEGSGGGGTSRRGGVLFSKNIFLSSLSLFLLRRPQRGSRAPHLSACRARAQPAQRPMSGAGEVPAPGPAGPQRAAEAAGGGPAPGESPEGRGGRGGRARTPPPGPACARFALPASSRGSRPRSAPGREGGIASPRCPSSGRGGAGGRDGCSLKRTRFWAPDLDVRLLGIPRLSGLASSSAPAGPL